MMKPWEKSKLKSECNTNEIVFKNTNEIVLKNKDVRNIQIVLTLVIWTPTLIDTPKVQS